jgi:hypothetical protein
VQGSQVLSSSGENKFFRASTSKMLCQIFIKRIRVGALKHCRYLFKWLIHSRRNFHAHCTLPNLTPQALAALIVVAFVYIGCGPVFFARTCACYGFFDRNFPWGRSYLLAVAVGAPVWYVALDPPLQGCTMPVVAWMEPLNVVACLISACIQCHSLTQLR